MDLADDLGVLDLNSVVEPRVLRQELPELICRGVRVLVVIFQSLFICRDNTFQYPECRHKELIAEEELENTLVIQIDYPPADLRQQCQVGSSQIILNCAEDAGHVGDVLCLRRG